MRAIAGTITDPAAERELEHEKIQAQLDLEATAPIATFTYNGVFRIVLVYSADPTGSKPMTGFELYKGDALAWDTKGQIKSFRPELMEDTILISRR